MESPSESRSVMISDASVATREKPPSAAEPIRRSCTARNGWSSANTTVKMTTASTNAAPLSFMSSRTRAATISPTAFAARATTVRTMSRITRRPYTIAAVWSSPGRPPSRLEPRLAGDRPDQLRHEPVDEPDDDRRPDVRPEPVDREVRHDPLGEQQHHDVHEEVRDAERQQDQRQRDERDERLEEDVREAEHGTCEQERAPALDREPVEDPVGDDQREDVDPPLDEGDDHPGHAREPTPLAGRLTPVVRRASGASGRRPCRPGSSACPSCTP